MAFRLLLKNDMKGSEPESITFVCSASSCIGLPRSSVRLVDWLLHFTFLYFLPKCLLLFVLFCFFVCLFVCLFVCFSQEMQIRAPFNVAPTPAYQPGLIYHNNAWKTPNQLVVESNVETENRPVEEKFPVSAGLDHPPVVLYWQILGAVMVGNETIVPRHLCKIGPEYEAIISFMYCKRSKLEVGEGLGTRLQE